MDSSNNAPSPSPEDLDAWTRTVATEAGDPDGQLAVASVIGNRLASGGYGSSPGAVVTAPGQFEVWQNGRAQGLSAQSPAYAKAAAIVNSVVSGQATDPTNGATHFYSPSGQAALGRQAPSWAQGQPLAYVGGNAFYAPHGAVQRQPDVNPDDVFDELTTRAQGNVSGGGLTTGAAGQPGSAQAPSAGVSGALGGAQDPVDSVFNELSQRAQQRMTPPAPAGTDASPAAPDGFRPLTVHVGSVAPSPPAAANPVPAASQGAGDDAAAVGRGVLNGVPVVGPYLLSGAEHAAAMARMATFGGTYAEALAHVQQFGTNTAAAHPYATVGGNALGAATATLPLMAAAPGLFGIGASSGLAGAAAGAGTGAAIGGVDSAVRSGGNALETGKGALVGSAAGLLGPVVGKAIGYGAGKILSGVSDLFASASGGVSPSARNALVEAINRDGPQAITEQLQNLGPDAMLADTGSATQGLAQGVAVRPAGSPLIQAIKDRAAGANARIRDAVSGLGPAEDPQTVTDNITALRSQVDRQNYGQALGNAPPVDIGHVVDLIDNQLETAVGMQRKALESVRSELVQQGANGQQLPVDNPQILHNLKGEIDNVIQHDAPGLGVPAGAVNRAQGSLQVVRGALNDALESQVPGYAEANAASSALARRAEAVQAGVNTLSSGKTAPTPERFIEQFNTLPPGEQIAQAKGLLGEVNRLVGTKANDLGAMRNALQGEEGWNTTKMARVLGDKPVNALMDTVNREGTFGRTFNNVVGNAQTAFRSESSRALDRQSPFGLDVDLSGVTTPGAVLGTLKNALYNPLVRFLGSTNTAARDTELASILSARGPTRDAFLSSLYQASKRGNALSEWGSALGNTGNALMNSSQEPYRLAR